jgi:phosphatidylserine decarboxylase
MVSYGIYYAAALLAGAAVVTYLLSWPFSIPFILLAIFCLNFFRDPDREAPLARSPSHPPTVKSSPVRPTPSGESRISIFLNVFDVHVNRTPIPGKVACITYKKGDFLVASKAEASSANEQNVITVDGVVGGRPTRVVFSQIAGLIARRIICYKKPGDILESAERVGLIKFGSRVDVILGPEWEVTVPVEFMYPPDLASSPA